MTCFERFSRLHAVLAFSRLKDERFSLSYFRMSFVFCFSDVFRCATLPFHDNSFHYWGVLWKKGILF